MAARTRLGGWGHGTRRAGSFAGRVEATGEASDFNTRIGPPRVRVIDQAKRRIIMGRPRERIKESV